MIDALNEDTTPGSLLAMRVYAERHWVRALFAICHERTQRRGPVRLSSFLFFTEAC